MSKILITGASGLLGTELCQRLKSKWDVIEMYHSLSDCVIAHNSLAADVTNLNQIRAAILSANPDVVIHTAGYTDVDGCELNSDKAFSVNADGTRNVSLACQQCSALLVYISTDFVFDGEAGLPYTEVDLPHPINVYGKSKLLGEKYVAELLDRWLIVRTAWLYGKHGKNFVDTILRLATEKRELKVVEDQIGSPTYTVDLVNPLGKLISLATERAFERCSETDSSFGMFNRIYHLVNAGQCSRYELALEILKIVGLTSTTVAPVTSEEFGAAAPRPKYSALASQSAETVIGERMRHWRKALQDYLKSTTN